jgi:hypothetical protein
MVFWNGIARDVPQFNMPQIGYYSAVQATLLIGALFSVVTTELVSSFHNYGD